MKVKTGKGEISLVVLVAILSVSAIVSLPGLAISPILDDLDKIFPMWHNDRYLRQCYYNLQEKYDYGGITDAEWIAIVGHLWMKVDKNE